MVPPVASDAPTPAPAPGNDGPIYSREQIVIPPEFPTILKNYSKFIIKNQPADIVAASVEYFSKLHKHQQLGRKVHTNGVAREQLETLYSMFNLRGSSNVPKDTLIKVAVDALIPPTTVDELLKVGSWDGLDSVNWIEFWALCCAVAAGTIQATALLAVDILTNNGQVPSDILVKLVRYLAKVDGAIDNDKLALCTNVLEGDGSWTLESKAVDAIKKYLV
ncbi:Ropporin-1-like protein [Allomyces arbusculus]|nr:Ropporin-1-like protein [Allomyces arbusculus]